MEIVEELGGGILNETQDSDTVTKVAAPLLDLLNKTLVMSLREYRHTHNTQQKQPGGSIWKQLMQQKDKKFEWTKKLYLATWNISNKKKTPEQCRETLILPQ